MCKCILIKIIIYISAAVNLSDVQRVECNEKVFRWEMNENQMATDKLSEGIRKFAADAVKLETIIQGKLA